MSEVKIREGHKCVKDQVAFTCQAAAQCIFHPLRTVCIPELVGDLLRCLLSRAATSEECVMLSRLSSHPPTHTHSLGVLIVDQ